MRLKQTPPDAARPHGCHHGCQFGINFVIHDKALNRWRFFLQFHHGCQNWREWHPWGRECKQELTQPPFAAPSAGMPLCEVPESRALWEREASPAWHPQSMAGGKAHRAKGVTHDGTPITAQ